MNEVAKYARTVLNAMEKRPRMHGDVLSVEMQYLMALEFMAIAEGFDAKSARKAYEHALVSRFKTSSMPAAYHEIPVEDVIDLLKSARDSVDPSRWVDMEDIAIE
jgi:hypothetical protein